MRPSTILILAALCGLAAVACERAPVQPEVIGHAGAATGVTLAESAYPEFAPHPGALADGLTLAGDPEALPLAGALAAALAHNSDGARPRVVAAAQNGGDSRRLAAVVLLSTMTPDALTTTQASASHLPVALNPIAIVVHPANPVAERGLTATEVAHIFAWQPREGEHVHFWADVGVAGEWTERRIARYGAAPHAPPFRRLALGGAPLKRDVRALPDSAAVIAAVAADTAGIGYASATQADERVAVVPLVPGAEPIPMAPGAQAGSSGTHPWTALVVVRLPPADGAGLAPAIAELLRFVYSAPGQGAIAQAGFMPLPPDTVWTLRARLVHSG